MNNFFKSLWNETSGTYVAASEIATSGGRKTASTRAARKMPRRGGNQRLVLEPRIVFDGAMPVAAADAAAAVENVETKTADTASKDASVAPPTTNTPSESTLPPAESAQQERELIDGTFALAGQTSNEVIFIDSAVEGLQNFLLDHQQADVVLL
ncbi:MAG: ESPR domain-containing protein, partial [Nitrosomonadaceae bacterium]|nr:ESPR domain-containing protein [Nitrosomonadaceae bacterium]